MADQQNHNTGGTANMPPFDPEPAAVRTAADHQIPAETGGDESGGGSFAGAGDQIQRTGDALHEAAPVLQNPSVGTARETLSNLRGQEGQALREEATRTASSLQSGAGRMARDLGERVESRINDTLSQTAERLETTAERIERLARERTEGAGGVTQRAGQMAGSVADMMDSAATYLRNQDVQGLRVDLERQMRERPLQTLLIGVAAGWVVGKILK